MSTTPVPSPGLALRCMETGNADLRVEIPYIAQFSEVRLAEMLRKPSRTASNITKKPDGS